MDVFYFLSNGVLLISKTLKGSEKSSGITQLERGTQFQTFHFNFQGLSKRGPLDLPDDFICQGSWNAMSEQFFLDDSPAAMFPSDDEVFGEPTVVEEILLEELLDDGIRGNTKLEFEPFTEFCNREVMTF
jgi:hypothetical protein